MTLMKRAKDMWVEDLVRELEKLREENESLREEVDYWKNQAEEFHDRLDRLLENLSF